MEDKFCWRCDMKVKMLNDDEFKLCREAWFGGKKVVEEELTRRKIEDYVWLDKIETFEQFRYLLEMYKLLTGAYESNPNVILHHQRSQFGIDCPNCEKLLRTPKAKYCASCGYGAENLTKV